MFKEITRWTSSTCVFLYTVYLMLPLPLLVETCYTWRLMYLFHKSVQSRWKCIQEHMSIHTYTTHHTYPHPRSHLSSQDCVAKLHLGRMFRYHLTHFFHSAAKSQMLEPWFTMLLSRQVRKKPSIYENNSLKSSKMGFFFFENYINACSRSLHERNELALLVMLFIIQELSLSLRLSTHRYCIKFI